jgi:hypothetical protein
LAEPLDRRGTSLLLKLSSGLKRDRLVRAAIEIKVDRYTRQLRIEISRLFGGDRFTQVLAHLVGIEAAAFSPRPKGGIAQ